MKIFTFLLIILISSQFTMAQEPPKYEMHSYRDSTNMLYWNRNKEVFLSLSATKDGKRENLESKVSSEYDNPFFFADAIMALLT